MLRYTPTSYLTIRNVPLSVWNRALELYGSEPAGDEREAIARLIYFDGLLPVEIGQKVHDFTFQGITPFAQALAEYMSKNDTMWGVI